MHAGKGKDIPRDHHGDAYMTSPSSSQTCMAEDEGHMEGAKKCWRADSGNRFDVLPIDVGGPNEAVSHWPTLPAPGTSSVPHSQSTAPGSLVPSRNNAAIAPMQPFAPSPATHARAKAYQNAPPPQHVPSSSHQRAPSFAPNQSGNVSGHQPEPATATQGEAAPGQGGNMEPAPVAGAPGQGHGDNGHAPATAAAAQFGAPGNNEPGPMQGAPPPSTAAAAAFAPNSVPFCEHIPEVKVGLHPQVAAAWDALEGPKAGIRPWMSRRNINAAQTIDAIHADIAQRVNISPRAVRLYFPTPAEPGPNFSAPNQLLLQFDPVLVPEPEALNHILTMFNNGDHGFRNTAAATYWVLPFTNPHVGSTFMGVVTGLSGLMETNIRIMRDMVRRELAADTVLENFIRTQRVNVPAHIADDNVFQWWLDTIRVNAITVNVPGGIPTLHFRAWCQYASDYVEAIDYVRRRFFSHTYMDGLHGIGVPDFFDRRCNNCKCLSHPTGLCPFARLPGFITPNMVPNGPTNAAPAASGSGVGASPNAGRGSFRGGPFRNNGRRGGLRGN
ncbi:hypothetical protein FISHEDRAFT_68734 [Fistulina hepatica ATCC 64428]|uniref:Uncharacterized protein n=1 Tax=Fistulina hepatica ATCC 64428 TaxID=1128425 RepID=A0A0D7APZ3_9AGAR|nr:hypothetical protein FISHEDRAFT_68734 [Fistulina hepatica ATCC 64428]